MLIMEKKTEATNAYLISHNSEKASKEEGAPFAQAVEMSPGLGGYD